MKGPVPIGCAQKTAGVSPARLLGITPLANRAISAWRGDQGVLVVTTTWNLLGVEMPLMSALMKVQGLLALAATRIIENLTSADVISWPLLNNTPWRRLNVHTKWLDDT